MRILFAGAADWANASNRIARGINAAAGERIARVLTLSGPHPFGYEEDRPTRDETLEWAKKTDWLISTGDGNYDHFLTVLQGLPFPLSLRIATAHVGSAYRNNVADFEQADRDFDFSLRFLGGDLYRFAADDPRAVPYFVPPQMVSKEYVPLGTVPRISHAPSSKETKGTEEILSILEGIEVDIINGLPFDECEKRRAQSHIFIDQLNDLGGYGAAAIEAMSAGCATLSSSANVHPKVAEFYPPPPIVDITRADLRTKLTWLLTDRHALPEIRRASHGWAKAVASPAAVGRYWLKHLEAAL